MCIYIYIHMFLLFMYIYVSCYAGIWWKSHFSYVAARWPQPWALGRWWSQLRPLAIGMALVEMGWNDQAWPSTNWWKIHVNYRIRPSINQSSNQAIDRSMSQDVNKSLSQSVRTVWTSQSTLTVQLEVRRENMEEFWKIWFEALMWHILSWKHHATKLVQLEEFANGRTKKKKSCRWKKKDWNLSLSAWP